MNSDSWRREQRDDFTLSELLNALWGRRLLVDIGFRFGILTAWPLHRFGSDFNDISWNIVISVSLSTSAG